MRSIPTFIVEEHHEAFLIWKYAIQNNLIPAKGNHLFHVDEHSDMASSQFSSSIRTLNGNLNSIKNFTYRELSIATFIFPSFYQEMFQSLYWIKQKHYHVKNKSIHMFVKSYNEAGKKLITGQTQPMLTHKKNQKGDSQFFTFYRHLIEEVPTQNNVVLDIDLDYFSCTGSNNKVDNVKVEITKQEYLNFTNNFYYQVKLASPGLEAIKENGKYYYKMIDKESKEPLDLKVSFQEIDRRIERFIDELKDKKINPILIDICRSRHSGYTPEDQWEYIENKLLEGLKTLGNLDVSNIQYVLQDIDKYSYN